MGNYNMCDILKTADHRAKRTEIGNLWILGIHIWGPFDLVVFNVILGSFSALVSNGL